MTRCFFTRRSIVRVTESGSTTAHLPCTPNFVEECEPMQVRSGRLFRLMSWIPAFSVGAFAGLYALSARLYPGGTKDDPSRVGFSPADNYWCDLLDATTYGGRPNPSRPIALAATIVLCAGLSVLWWTVPALFQDARRRGRLVRYAGLASAAVTPLVGTPLHDWAIDAAGLLGVVAFGATLSAMRNQGGRASSVLAALTLLLAVANFIVWQTGAGLLVLPLIQKVAFASFLLWVVLMSRRVAENRAEA
jgi:hypothetical protein